MNTKQNKYKWRKLISRGLQPVLFVDCVRLGIIKYFDEVVGLFLGKNLACRAFKRENKTSFMLESDWQRQVRAASNLFRRRKIQKIFDLMNDRQKRQLNRISEAKKLQKKYRYIDESKIANFKKDVLNFLRGFAEDWAYCYIPFVFEDVIEPILRKSLQKSGIKKDKIDDVIADLAKPDQFLKNQLAQKNLLEIKCKTFSAAKLEKEIQRHRQRFGAIRSYIFNIQPYDITEIKKEIKTIKSKNCQELLNNFEANNLGLVTRDKVIKHYNINKNTQRLIHLYQKLVWWRTSSIELATEAIYHFKSILDVLAEYFKISYNRLVWATLDEIGNEKINQDVLDDRARGYYFLATSKKLVINTKGVFREKLIKVAQIFGRVAYPGKVTGRAQVLYNYEFHKLKAKTVLVTPMTTPDATQFLKQTKAIITDEGGMLCHAAIVSRELGIPCIIGTKIATKVLKDGDLVEVDAERGIVRKIK